jgi:Spy/CpxP family protein refolding chaperone
MLVLGLAAQVGFAQNPPAPPDPAAMAQHHLQFLTTVLSLTSAQQQQAMTLMTSATSSEENLHAQDKAAHEALDAAVTANNTSAISQAAATIGNVAAQRAEIHGKAMAAFYQLLTPDQQTKFSQLKAQGAAMGGPGHHPMN